MNKRRRRKSFHSPEYAMLELRRVLAGNVTAFVNDGVLSIFGDADANQIEVTPTAEGGIQVAGVDTTVNGVATPFTTTGIGFITIGLGNGDDDVTVSNIGIRGNLSIFGETGNDRLVVEGSRSRFLHVRGGGENDVIELDHAARESAYVYLDDGDDVLSVVDVFAGRNFKVYGGEGDDTVASRSIRVGRRFEVFLENGDDQVLISGRSQVRKVAKIYVGDGNDFVSIGADDNSISSHFDRQLRVRLGDGDDNLAIGENASFDTRADLEGGQGTDSLDGGTNVSGNESSFENEAVANLQALIDNVIADLDAAGVDNTQPISDLAISTTGTTLTVAEDSAATAVDPGLTLTGDGNVQTATVSIENFVEGSETLAFNDLDGITGALNETTGDLVLTGDASTSVFQTALRSVTYQNTSDDPATATRQISVTVVSDEETVSATRDLQITAINDTPTIDLAASDQTISADALPVTIDGGLTIADVDNSTLSSAEVAIATGFESGEDELTFTAPDGMTGNFDATTGVLTFTGANGEDPTIDEFQTALRSVQFANNATEPTAGSRVIRFEVNDGEASEFEELTLTIQPAAN